MSDDFGKIWQWVHGYSILQMPAFMDHCPETTVETLLLDKSPLLATLLCNQTCMTPMSGVVPALPAGVAETSVAPMALAPQVLHAITQKRMPVASGGIQDPESDLALPSEVAPMITGVINLVGILTFSESLN